MNAIFYHMLHTSGKQSDQDILNRLQQIVWDSFHFGEPSTALGVLARTQMGGRPTRQGIVYTIPRVMMEQVIDMCKLHAAQHDTDTAVLMTEIENIDHKPESQKWNLLIKSKVFHDTFGLVFDNQTNKNHIAFFREEAGELVKTKIKETEEYNKQKEILGL